MGLDGEPGGCVPDRIEEIEDLRDSIERRSGWKNF